MKVSGEHAAARARHLSNEALVALVAVGDEHAFAELYDRIAPPAYRLALRVVRAPMVAEDVLQEAFHAVWQSAGAYSPGRGRAITWILTIVHRRAVDAIRHETRRRPTPEWLAEVHAEVAADEEWDLGERERVLSALARLPAAQREAIELAYYEGLTQREVADRQRVPVGTVKSRMFAGLARLAELLDDAPAAERGSRPALA